MIAETTPLSLATDSKSHCTDHEARTCIIHVTTKKYSQQVKSFPSSTNETWTIRARIVPCVGRNRYCLLITYSHRIKIFRSRIPCKYLSISPEEIKFHAYPIFVNSMSTRRIKAKFRFALWQQPFPFQIRLNNTMTIWCSPHVITFRLYHCCRPDW